jgi:hypothetical protein
MEQIIYREISSHSVIQKVASLLWNSKVYYSQEPTTGVYPRPN